MKQFWLNSNIRTKVILIIFIIVILLSFIGWANYKEPVASTAGNSNFVDKITNRNPILSYPVSYSSEWNGSISLVPEKLRELEYAASNNEECSGITNKMDVYYTPQLDSIMIINNKNLLVTNTENANFNTAVSIISGESNFDSSNAELQSFRTYCPYFSLFLVEELDNKFPNTDASRSIVGIGLRQGDAINISDLGLYIYVYALKDDYIIQLSRSLQGSFLFSQANWDNCKTKALQIDQNKCLQNIYLNDPSMVSKIENDTNNLIQVFKLEDGE